MKSIYVVIVLLILGGFWLMMSGEPEAPVVEQSEELLPTDESTVNPPSEMPANETGGEASVGADSDTMELPDQATEDGVLSEKVFNLDSFKYGYSETEIRVKKGDTVTINLTSSDGLHDWVVDEFDAATEKISDGGNTSVTFVASETGTFEFYCSVGSHRALGMVGNLIVE